MQGAAACAFVYQALDKGDTKVDKDSKNTQAGRVSAKECVRASVSVCVCV